MTVQIDVAAQFDSRPSLHDVATGMLRDEFADRYPHLTIDPRVASVRRLDASGTTAPNDSLALTDVLLCSFASQTAPDWEAGRDALWTDPDASVAEPQIIDVAHLSASIARLSFGLLETFAQAQADYWSALGSTGVSRWQWLADSLKQKLVDDAHALTSQDWDPASRDGLQTVSMFADKAQREFILGLTPNIQDRLNLNVGILHLKVTNEATSVSLPFPALVVCYRQAGRLQVTTWRPSGKVHRASTIDDLVMAVCAEMAGQWIFDQVDWSFREAEGNIFHDLAQAILGRQVSDIRALQGAAFYDLPELEHYLTAATDVCALFQNGAPPGLNMAVLPDWLRTAPDAARLRFSRGLAELAREQFKSGGRAFNDELPPILDFASKALTRELRRDHPEETRVRPEDVLVVIYKVVGAASASAGQMIASGTVEPVSMTFAQFALNNLCSLPVGEVSVRHVQGLALPAWLTPGYLKELVTRVDIGSAYPRLVQRYLIDDASEAARRRRLFTDQLRVQLPLRALEQRLRGEGGLTDAGCRVVAAVVQQDPALQRIGTHRVVLRPLSFVSAPGRAPDVVANMFVIGRQNTGSGPYVLYRPFNPVPLAEYATWPQLLQAIVRPGALQDEVLTWLADRARPIYANGGFHEPHIVRFGQGSDFAPLERPAPAVLGRDVCSGDPLTALFEANARALVTLADRDSVSDAESRWAILKEGGWTLLNTLLPLVGGPVATAAWLAQLLVSVDRFASAPVSTDAQSRSVNLAELLLNISLILLHQRVSAHGLAYREFVPRAAREVTGRQAEINEVTLERVEPVLDFRWSNPLNQLDSAQRADLQAFRLTRISGEQTLAGEADQAGVYHSQGRTLIRMGAQVYRVERDDDGYYIVEPLQGDRRGPRVVRDGAGWRLDLGLRLRGGGPKKRARELAEQNAATLKRVQEARAVLGRRRDDLYRKMQAYNAQLDTAGEEVRALFLSRYASDLEAALDVVRERAALVQELRLADRPSERELAADLKDVCSRVRYLEGLMFKDVSDIARSSMEAMRSPETGDEVVPGNVDAYIVLFNKMVSRQDRGCTWAAIRESLWAQLREVPQAGDGFWREEVADFERTRLPSLLEWKIMRLFSRLELTFSREDILREDAIKPLKDLRVSGNLYDAMSSHAQLERPNSYSLPERIDVLESALREYDRASEIASYVRETDFLDRQNDHLDSFITELQSLKATTEGQLTALIQEKTDPPALPVERLPRREQPRKRIIRTRDRRVLVADVRGEPGDFPGQVVDVHDVLTQRVINSWHQHEDGDWTQIETVTARPPAPAPVARGELRQRATALLAQADQAIASVWRQAARASEPEDMEDILTQKAARMTELAAALGDADSERLVTLLRQAAARLTEQGRAVRIDMIKRQPPTAARVSYLHRQGEINIARVDGRTNLSGARRDDFLQEYSIRDKHQQLLWWAHFHYASENAAPADFTAAHLKLPEQRMLGYKALVRAAKDNKAVVAIYRSAIGKEVAQRLFLALAR
jgi:hypothetical protein